MTEIKTHKVNTYETGGWCLLQFLTVLFENIIYDIAINGYITWFYYDLKAI